MQPIIIFWIIVLVLLLAIWDGIWKAIALWHSARDSKKVWFVFILIINSIGILPIVYLLLRKKGMRKKRKRK